MVENSICSDLGQCHISISKWSTCSDQPTTQQQKHKKGDNVGYQRPSIDSTERFQFSQMMLKNDDDVRSMFSIFGRHNTFSTIELDVSLLRSFEDILKSLIELDEDVRLYEIVLCNVITLLELSLIHGSLLKMFALKYLILGVTVCQSLWKLERID